MVLFLFKWENNDNNVQIFNDVLDGNMMMKMFNNLILSDKKTETVKSYIFNSVKGIGDYSFYQCE